MAEESLPTVPLSGKPASLESIRLSLARIELTGIEAITKAYSSAIRSILDMDDPTGAIPIIDWLASNAQEVANLQQRLDRAQDILGAEVRL